MKVANDVSLLVPETLISIDQKKIFDFLKEGICVTKGIGSSSVLMDGTLRTARTSIVSIENYDLAHVISCPTLLQRYIRAKAMWRFVNVGKKVFGFRLEGDALYEEVDSRLIEDKLSGKLCEIPAEIESKYLQMIDKFSILYASSDFIEDENGNLWFIDLNPDGQWGAYEERFNVPISDEIISLSKN